MDYKSRISRIKVLLQKERLDAVLISSVPYITYLIEYSGFSTEEREAFLVITKDKNLIITDGRYREVVQKKLPHFKLLERNSKQTIDYHLKNLSQIISDLGFEGDTITYKEYSLFSNYFKTLKDIDIKEIRAIKDLHEIRAIKKACAIGDKAFQYILNELKLGITEKEVGYKLEVFIKSKGADLSFKTIVAFGKNSSMPHYITANQKLKANMIVLFDFGVRYKNYCSDMTRTVFFGKADKKFKKIYNTVHKAQTEAIDFIKTAKRKDCTAQSIDKKAREFIIKNGFSTIPHSLGHGIGLEVHEYPYISPTSNTLLQKGMVFSIEPGIYIPNFGGVRIEDLVSITNNKLEILTHSPRKLIEI